MTMQIGFCKQCEGKGSLTNAGLCAWCFDEQNKAIADNEKCDTGDCLMCYPQYFYNEATDEVLIREAN
jgi:hypothetical protein